MRSLKGRILASHIARLSVLALLLAALPVLGSATGASAAPNFVQIDGGGSDVCGVTRQRRRGVLGLRRMGRARESGPPDPDPRTRSPVTGLRAESSRWRRALLLVRADDRRHGQVLGHERGGELGDGTSTHSYMPSTSGHHQRDAESTPETSHGARVLRRNGPVLGLRPSVPARQQRQPGQDNVAPSPCPASPTRHRSRRGASTRARSSGAAPWSAGAHNQNGEIGDGGAHSPRGDVPRAVRGSRAGSPRSPPRASTRARSSAAHEVLGPQRLRRGRHRPPGFQLQHAAGRVGLTPGTDEMARPATPRAPSPPALSSAGGATSSAKWATDHGSGTGSPTPGPGLGTLERRERRDDCGRESACALMDDHRQVLGLQRLRPARQRRPGVDSDVPVDVVGAAPSADLQLSMTDSPDPVTSQNDVLYHLAVHNAGPDHADGVVLDITPAGPSTSGSIPVLRVQRRRGETSSATARHHPERRHASVDIVMLAPA